MSGETKGRSRFADAFVDELGKWVARLVIAGIVVILSGWVNLSS